jgi:hypothetical protein
MTCGYKLPQRNENCIKGGDLDRSLNVPPCPLSHSLQIDAPARRYLAFSLNSATFRNLFFKK